MGKILRFVLIMTLLTKAAWSQICSVPTLKTQTDVDNFNTTYPGCTVINSDLDISSSSISNLDGLRNVTQVVRTVKINDNPNLTSLSGLSSLKQIGISLAIGNNDSLVTLDGLQNLVSPIDGVTIVDNERLISIGELSGITRILVNLSIGSNPALTSLNGLHNVSRVRGSVSIASNDKLQDLYGLRRLKEMNWWCYIGNNKSLKSLRGLERLVTLEDGLEITGNGALTSISELAQLENTSQISITNNPILSDCAIKMVCSRIAFGRSTISGNAAGCNTNEEVRSTQICTPQTLVRINAGGPDFTTATQKLFVADQYYTGIDRTSSIASGDILNTTNDVLYRSARCSPSFSYNIPVVNNNVNVILHFAETYFGAPGKKGGAGSRQFHVNIEGRRKLTNYDIFTATGGALRAVAVTIPVTVTDGVLNIDFLTGAADLPRVSAIEVTASPTLLPIDDAFVSGGFESNYNYNLSYSLQIRQASGSTTINRFSYLKFQLPSGKASITSAKLRIYGRNEENNNSVSIHAYGVYDDSWTESKITRNNAPTSLTPSLGYAVVNDIYKYHEIDVTSFVKEQQLGDGMVSLLVNDPNYRSTSVRLNSKESGSNPPQLVIQTTNVVQTTSNVARVGDKEVSSEIQVKQPSSVFPNPVKDQLTVSLSMEHAGLISCELVNAAGKSHAVPSLQNAKSSGNAELNIDGLRLDAGIYLLKIKSDTFTEVVKVLVAE